MSFYITTAISYVNGPPHIGHAYEAIATDVLARHMRQRGEDVFFLTGTDEHGEPVADAAHAEGVEPQVLADRNAARFREMAAALEISNDFFIRTTDVKGARLRKHADYQRAYAAGRKRQSASMSWFLRRAQPVDDAPRRRRPARRPHRGQGAGQGARAQPHQAPHARGPAPPCGPAAHGLRSDPASAPRRAHAGIRET